MVAAMTLRAGVLVIAVAVAMVSACGGQSASTPASSSKTSTTAVEAPTTTEPEVIAELEAFTSPTGNVGCYVDSTSARCDVSERNWTPPPRPKDCEFDYGRGLTLLVGESPQFVCAGDTALGGGSPLPYGQSITVGTLRCDSAESGITCTDSTTKHGFTIARERYQLF